MNKQYTMIHKENVEVEEEDEWGKGSNTPEFFN